MSIDNSTLGYLKQAINNLEKTNRMLLISNLLSTGRITDEEALSDPDYREYIQNLKSKTNQSEHRVIMAKRR